MAGNNTILLSDQSQNGSYWVVPLAGFANPKYAAASPDDPTGFDIGNFEAYVISFENGATATVVHEQTLDPTGLAGWFPVVGKLLSSATGQLLSGAVSGQSYMFSAVGARARVRFTALTVADCRVRVAVVQKAADISTALSAVTVSSATAQDAVAPTTMLGVACEARNTQKTAMSATGDIVNIQGTMDGKVVVQPNAVPDLSWQYAAVAGGIVSSTADVAVKAALATYRNYVKSIDISHDALSAASEIVIKDGATVIWRGKLQTTALEGRTINFDPPLRGSVNTAVNVAMVSSVTGGVYVNLQGYTGV